MPGPIQNYVGILMTSLTENTLANYLSFIQFVLMINQILSTINHCSSALRHFVPAPSVYATVLMAM